MLSTAPLSATLLANPPSPASSLTKILKPIFRQAAQTDLRVEMLTDERGRVAWLRVSGQPWQAVITSLLLLGRRRLVTREEVLLTLEGFSSLEDSLEIYEPTLSDCHPSL